MAKILNENLARGRRAHNNNKTYTYIHKCIPREIDPSFRISLIIITITRVQK